jgi:hypothetical protein
MSSNKVDARGKVYLRLLMRLTEKFGANADAAKSIKKVLDDYLNTNPNFDSEVS